MLLIQNFNWESLFDSNVDAFLELFCAKLNMFYCDSFPLKEKTVSNKKSINLWCTPAIENLLSIKSKYFNLLKLGIVTKNENNLFKNKVKKIIDTTKTS